MKKICFIYPKDLTTDFLEYIPSFIRDKGREENIEIIRIVSDEESHNSCLESINHASNDKLFIFLGHGTNHCLSGAKSQDFQKEEFITEYNLSVFKNKNVLFLACRSEQFITNFFELAKFNSAIGFGELPTDYEEIEDLRRLDEFYDNVTNEVVEEFKNSIVEIIGFCLLDSVMENFTMKDLFLRIRLRLNKLMSKITISSNSAENRALVRLLFEMKCEMKIVGQSESLIFPKEKEPINQP